MRKLILTTLVILLLLIAAVIAAPFVLPTSFVKNQIQSLASNALGRELRIDGDLSYTLWPPLTLHVSGVSLANRPGEPEPNMLALDSLDLEMNALAYSDGRIEIGRLNIVRPVAHLAIDADGVANWELAGAGADDREVRDGSGSDRSGSGDGLPRLVIGEITIEDGLVTFRDDPSGMERRFEAIGLTVAGSEGGDALDIRGSVTQGGEAATLEGRVGDANALAAGGNSPLDLALSLPGGAAKLTGELDAGGSAFDLATDVNIEDLRRLASWAGQSLDLPEGTLRSIAVEAKLVGDPAEVHVAPLSLAVDDLAVTGDLSIITGERTRIGGSLGLGMLVLDPYLPPETESAPAAAEGGASEAGWPEEPLDLPLPLPVDLDLVLEMDGLVARKVELGAGKVELFADSLTTKVTVPTLALYEGEMSAGIDIASAEPPRFGLEARGADIALFPILQSFADFERLEGIGNLDIAVETSGDSIAQLMQALDGRGEVLFRDGAVLGINLGAMMRSVMTLGVSQEAQAAKKTDFAELGGSFIIEQGLLHNDDLALRAPLLRVTGAGRVDLPAQTLDYALTPRVASTLEGQDASGEPTFDLGVPVVFEGPWSDPDFRLEIGGALTGDVTDPAALADAIGNMAADGEQLKKLQEQLGAGAEGGIGGLVEGLVGGRGDNATNAPVSDSETPATEAPADAPKKLLDAVGGIFGKD